MDAKKAPGGASSSSAEQQVRPEERFVSMCVGYVAGSIVAVPFDRVKTLMQAMPCQTSSATRIACDVFRRDGVRGLYRGFDTQMLCAPYQAIYYSVYCELLSFQIGGSFAPLFSAMCARTFEVTIRCPVELLRTRLQAEPGRLRLIDLVREQAKQPLISWMRGYTPTLLRDVPFSAIYWWAYEETKQRVRIPENWFSQRPGLRTFTHSFVSGGLAGTFAALVTTPTDVVKTLRQALTEEAAGRVGSGAEHQRPPSGPKPASSSYPDILRFIAAHPRAGLAGVGPRLLRIPLGLATMMAGLETTRSYFHRRRSRKTMSSTEAADG